MPEEYENQPRKPDLRRGWLLIDTITLEEEMFYERNESEYPVDHFWSRGWSSGAFMLRRSNYDYFDGSLHKVFPLRNKIWDFKLTKSQRRVINKNEDLKTIIRPLRITLAKEKLHHDHHWMRHSAAPRETLSQMYKDPKFFPTDLMELCVFDDSKLIACSIFEAAEFSIMANIAFWDIEHADRSLGIFTILKEIEYARSRKFYYYYQSTYYKANPRYEYKTHFAGTEIFDWDGEHWIYFEHPRVPELLDQKLPTHSLGG